MQLFGLVSGSGNENKFIWPLVIVLQLKLELLLIFLYAARRLFYKQWVAVYGKSSSFIFLNNGISNPYRIYIIVISRQSSFIII
jgi:hypothetical protein